jgi:hypothetical protein
MSAGECRRMWLCVCVDTDAPLPTGASSVTGFSPTSSGFGGNQTLTITGTGFWSEANTPGGTSLQAMTATVCGRPCAILPGSTSTSIACAVPEMVTAASIEGFRQQEGRVAVLTGKAIGKNFDASPVFDGSLETASQASYWWVF